MGRDPVGHGQTLKGWIVIVCLACYRAGRPRRSPRVLMTPAPSRCFGGERSPAPCGSRLSWHVAIRCAGARSEGPMAIADFDGDGRSEIPVSSPWGIGILELSGSTLAS